MNLELIKQEFEKLNNMELDEKVETINDLKLMLKEYSPFKDNPVDFVIWKKNGLIEANDYNPNSVAPVEMKLLETSIDRDGYTQPIVSWEKEDGNYEVVDGFHRNRVGKESDLIRERVKGYLPLVVINDSRLDLGDRMASTIRHNRARGKHRIDSMSDIVMELKKRNWKDEKIANELGMDADEVLRLAQITGLAEIFNETDFSEAWEMELEEFEETIE